MNVIDVVKELIKMGLTGIKIEHDKEKDMFYYDLNTRAKSHLYLYEDWHVEGRYGYTLSVEGCGDMSCVLHSLFWEFKECLHGRDFYNQEWMEIGVKLGCIKKKVQTNTTTTYEDY